MVLNVYMTTTSNLRKQADSNWITGTVDGLLVQAKCYDEPSHYGMELDGRISKLWVSTPGDPSERICLYNYDRGLDTDHLKADALAMIVKAVAAKIK